MGSSVSSVGSCARRCLRSTQAKQAPECDGDIVPDLEKQKLSHLSEKQASRQSSRCSPKSDDDLDFFSCDEAAIVDAIAPRGHSLSRESTPASTPRLNLRPKLPPQNKNRVSQYAWCEKLLQMIADGSAKSATGVDGQKSSTPLFIVAGACPNSFCAMQAVLFSQTDEKVDFWWIKPSQADPMQLEPATLSLHADGPFKNVPGRSRPVYAPLAEKFAAGVDGDFVFGVDDTGRAFIEEDGGEGHRSRLFLLLVWQESWSSPLAYKKFIRGKILFQKGRCGSRGTLFFTRQYEIRDGQISIAARHEEESVETVLPPDSIQEMYAMSNLGS